MTNTAIVDVLMPVFNAAPTLRVSLDSILCQTIRNIRVVVVDDGSTDATPTILADYAAADHRLAIFTKSNSGIVDALNTGLAHCKSDYVARFDADDIAFPYRLECQLDYLHRNPGCVGVGSGVVHIDETGQIIQGLSLPGNPSNADATWAPAREPYLIHPYLMARREALISVGGYRYVHHSEDSDLYWRLAEVGTLHNLEKMLGQYRVHVGSVSSASILNGRIMAVSSQLGAISATRRRKRRHDISFFPHAIDEYRTQLTMDNICRAASVDLDGVETQHLQIAAAGKLMELAAYRPYELETSDCEFICRSLQFTKHLTKQNQKEIWRHVTRTAARLVKTKKMREAIALTPPSTYPVVIARALISSNVKKAYSSGGGYQN